MSVFSVVAYGGVWLLLNQALFLFIYLIASGKQPAKLGRIKPSVNSDDINSYIRHQVGENVQLAAVYVDRSDEEYKKEMIKKTQGPQNVSSGVVKVFASMMVMSLNFMALMMVEITVGSENVMPGAVIHFFIDLLVMVLSVVQPFILVNLVLHKKMVPDIRVKRQVASSAVGIVVWLCFLHGFGVLSQSFTPSHSVDHARSMMEKKSNEVSILGITTLAVLSGVGCISTPWELFSLKSMLLKWKQDEFLSPKKKIVTEQSINNTIVGLNQTTSLLKKRRSELNSLLVSNAGTIYNNPNKSSDYVLLGGNVKSSRMQRAEGLFHKVQSFASLSSLSLSSEKSEQKELNEEISNLDSLQQNIYDELLKQIVEFKIQRVNEQNSEALSESVMRICRAAFGIYCIYRFANIFLLWVWSGLFQDTENLSDLILQESSVDGEFSPPSKDALAITLSKLIKTIFSLTISESQLVNQISFILSGSLFLCSFSSVLTTLKSFSRFLPASIWEQSVANKYTTLLFLLSQLLGVYIFATALLIRTILPSSMSHQISKILSLSGRAVTNESIAIKEVQFIDNWFNKVFLISGLVTLASLGIKHFVYRDDEYDYDDNYDEESFMEDTPHKF